MKTLADALREQMGAKGLKAKALARMAGVNETYIRDILSGKSRNPRVEHLKKVATALGTSLDGEWLSASAASITMTDKDLMPAVASRLRALRKEANQQLQIRTVDEFAALIGAERNQVSNWLNAYNLPPVWMMVRICEQFGITLDWLVRGTLERCPWTSPYGLQRC
jgi:transcriptional regulator with XRE-family HTH domain